MKKVLFILVTIMLVTFSCKDDNEVEIDRACYEFTTTTTTVLEYSDTFFEPFETKTTKTTVACDLTSSDALAISISELYNNSYTEEVSTMGMTVKVTETTTTTYKKL